MPETDDNNAGIYVYIGLSLLVIGILLGFLYRCEKKTCSPYKPDMTGEQLRTYFNKDSGNARDMCLCSANGRKLCTNRQKMIMSYAEGNTENQDFADAQHAAGGPIWKNTNFAPGC
jgi:LPXTG-motif cell wall-anchored protein